MSSQSGYGVYTGFWVNWSRGRISGSTITLSFYSGLVFQNFLVLYVRFAGSKSWQIVRYLIHRARILHNIRTELSDSIDLKARDGAWFQQQIVLRNGTSDLGAIWDLVRIWHSWRRIAPKSFRKSCLLASCAAVHAIAWIIAALFVSKVAHTAYSDVLLRSDTCGSIDYEYSDNDTSAELLVNQKIVKDMNAAWAYAETCYSNTNPYHRVGCNLLSANFGAISNRSAACPFHGLCLNSHGAYSVDSGYVNSNKHFGINSRGVNQIDYRRITTCAPLNTTSFTSTFEMAAKTEDTSLDAGIVLKKFNFGPDEAWDNATFEFTTSSTPSYTTYYADTAQYQPNADRNDWAPIEVLNRTDGDVTLVFFMANHVIYQSPIDDPMFSAHVPYITDDNATYYNADNDVAVLGCLEQYQFCNPGSSSDDEKRRCADLQGSINVIDSLESLSLTHGQVLTGQRIADLITPSSIEEVVKPEGFSKAASTLYGIAQTVNLPNDQWIIEVNAWLATSLAFIQGQLVQYAAGQDGLDPSRLITPSDPFERYMCKNQIIKSVEGHTSFSFLGIMIILLLGGLIILVGAFIETIVSLLCRHVKYQNLSETAWNLDNMFQIQRKAFEGQMQGNWDTGMKKYIPVTADDEKLEYFALRGLEKHEYSALEGLEKHDYPDLQKLEKQREVES